MLDGSVHVAPRLRFDLQGALETRRRKEYGVPVHRLREQWRARAAEHGLDRDALSRVLRHRPQRRIDERGLAERLEGPDGLTRDASSFTRRDVLLAGEGVVELEPVARERRYSTRDLLALERAALDRAQRLRQVPTVTESALAAALASRPRTTPASG